MTPEPPDVFAVSRRQFADFLLFGITAGELALLFVLTPALTPVDWIYITQHLLVLGIALTRPAPPVQDRSLPSTVAVIVAYAYPYAQVVYLRWMPGDPAWPEGGFIVEGLAACLSLASLLSIGRSFGIRPALRALTTGGPYRFVRHPMYLAYVIADIGLNLQEWNVGAISLAIIGWASLLYRIRAEERVLSQDAGWPTYVASVRYRLFPGLW